MLKKIGVVTGGQWVLGLAALSVAGSNLGIKAGLVFLLILAVGNAVSFVLAEKGSAN